MDQIKYKLLENLPQLRPEDVLAFKTALEKYYGERQDEKTVQIIPIDDIVLEIGVGLIPLALLKENNIVDRMEKIRTGIELRYGIRPPYIRIMDNTLLDTYEYRIKIKGEELGRYKINADKFLAVDGGEVKNEINGETVSDPVFGVPAVLIDKDRIESASDAGYVIADALTIICTHLYNIIETNLEKLFSYQNAKEILSHVKNRNPELVNDVLTNNKFIDLKYILMKLVTKKVSLNNIERILELLLKNINEDKDEVIKNIEKEFKL
jgi:flagellar biosynthesis protein FlhA